ncbi:MAG: hypothetical protein M3Y75_11815 [Actinomycetota bacterium]|nr:hypothetical protein [Actinomycetota bacterium]
MRGYARIHMGLYLRLTRRRNRDGSTVAYYGLAENVWNAATQRAEARVVHSFGRADQLDREALNRLVRSISRVLGAEEPDRAAARGLPEIEIERVFELGVVVAARALREALGIGPAIRRQLDAAGLSAPHEAALFAMAANRLDDPTSKLACAERWLPDVAWLPEARGLKVDQLYRALDVLAGQAEGIEREVFLRTADLFKLDVDLIFYDTTAAWFAVDEEDDGADGGPGRRRRGHAKDGPEGAPQVVIALAVTRDGMPVRSWVLPGDTADVATVARIKDDLRAWRLGRCVLVGDAGLYTRPTISASSPAASAVISSPCRCAGSRRSRPRCWPGPAATARSPTTFRSRRSGSVPASGAGATWSASTPRRRSTGAGTGPWSSRHSRPSSGCWPTAMPSIPGPPVTPSPRGASPAT